MCSNIYVFNFFFQCDNGDVHFKGVWSKLYPNINADDDADAIDSNEKSNTPHLKPLGHISPDSRAAHGGAILTNKIFGSDTTKIFIFGGFSTTGALNDMFCFDTNDQSKGDTNDKDEEGEGNDEEKSNDDDDDDVDAYCQDYFFIHGGMDTEGKVFNDAYLLLLSEYQISNPMNCQTILNEYTCKNI
ncbi:unnamed protein product [Trichobilharzia regenti]|nr:unnamed protein product [Trichobilharzia regenti]